MTLDSDGQQRFVVVVGFGPVGRHVADRLEKTGVRCRFIELNEATCRKHVPQRDMICGDATDSAVLRTAGIERADAVILTIPDDKAMVRACRAIKAIAPNVTLVVRARHLSQGLLARTEGADQVVVEEIAAAELLADLVQHRLADPRSATTPETAGEDGPAKK